jgi:cytochrome c biogenesis protein
MRTALLLRLLLGVAAVPGSVFPQRRIDPGRVQTYLLDHPGAGPVLDRLGLFDVYSSPWFSAIYLLLFVSLVGCVLPRSRQHLRALRTTPPRTPSRLDRLPATVTTTADDLDPESVLAAAREVLRRRRYRTADHGPVGGPADSVSAEKGHLAETGNLVFHLALLGLLVAIAAGSYVGYSGQAIVVEGHSFADVLPSYDSFSAGRLVDTGNLPPFSLELRRLAVKFETAPGSQFGSPRQFDATVAVKDTPDAVPRPVVVSPNRPLDVNGTRVFLVGNGYAPTITVRDADGRIAYRATVPALPLDGSYTSTVVVKVPDAKPSQLALAGNLFPSYRVDPVNGVESAFPDAIDPRLTLTVWAAKPGQDGLGLNTGVPQSVYRLDVRNLTQLLNTTGEPVRMLLAPGSTVTLPGGAGSVTFDSLSRYAALDIRFDPTKGWALTMAVLALAGVTASLFVRRRRTWVRVGRDGEGRTLVQVAGLARGDDPGLAAEIEGLSAQVLALARDRVTSRRPAGGEPNSRAREG